MSYYCVELTATHRQDDSIFIVSQSLPMFGVVAENEESALELALKVMHEYLELNVPGYINLSVIPDIAELFGVKRISSLPVYVVVRTGKR